MAKESNINTRASEKIKVEYKFRTLLGVIGSWVKAREDKIGNDLYIDIFDPNKFDRIYINGKLLKDIIN